ncbi:MAG: N-formylglutamate amidohydrolase [Sphingopyxis sp.]|nr:MAG: N-formylglutamate amidohydrolase [Sphingopyxis sp.]
MELFDRSQVDLLMTPNILLDDPENGPPWNQICGGGQILVTSIHAGHNIRMELQPWLAIGEKDCLREEDPMTDYFLTVADNLIRANRSRFECDLNRPRERCISANPDDTWGLKIWADDLPEEQMENSRLIHDAFYDMARKQCDQLIGKHGRILILDLHSYNHRRNGPDGEGEPRPENPDIDIGATTLDKSVYGELVERMTKKLRSVPLLGETPDVRENKRFPDGGNFPEWLADIYGEKAGVMTLEYKKIFMDEWGDTANILALQHLRAGLTAAVQEADTWLKETR